ncbi:MAG: hypothetical protein R3E46_03465 [Sedimenticolaceae bacterium]
MRIVINGTLATVLTFSLSGCATLKTPTDAAMPAAISTPAPAPLSAAYAHLEQSGTPDTIMTVQFPDGFGGSGVQVIRRYFSASGKRCTVAVDTATQRQRTLCRDSQGVVNSFGPSDIPNVR